VTAVPLTDIEPLRPLLSTLPLGVFSDIDGTLSPIVDRPEDARVTPRCRDLLKRLIHADVRVALITGRPLDVARSMVGLDGAAYAANHGLEFWVDGKSEIKDGGGDYFALVDQVSRRADELAKEGVTIELKGQGLAFHFRQAGDETLGVALIEDVIKSAPAAAGGFQRIEGRKVIELRPDVAASKGTAALRLARQLGLNAVICVGDDTTDVAMFDAAHGLKKQGMGAVAVAVLSPEIHPDVLGAADYGVEGVGGVEWLLSELVDATKPTAG
jgi:trehalose-phosphatase